MTPPADEPVEVAFPSSPPIAIDDAETVEKGHVEINLTVGFSGRVGSWESEAPLVDGNLGLTDNIHVNAEIPYVFGGEDGVVSHGLGSGAVAVKVRLVHTGRVQLAVHPAVEFPPLPAVSYEAPGAATFTLPAVVDVALGHRGIGMGLQLSRSFTKVAAEDTWGGVVGVAAPLGGGDLMVDYAQETGPTLVFGEGWVEVGYVHGDLFGAEALTLLSALGRSTEGNSSVLLGVQVGL